MNRQGWEACPVQVKRAALSGELYRLSRTRTDLSLRWEKKCQSLYVLFMRVQGSMKHKIDMPGTRESKELENKSDALPLGDAPKGGEIRTRDVRSQRL